MGVVKTAKYDELWRIEFNNLHEMQEEQKAEDDEYYRRIIEQKNEALCQKDAELARLRKELDTLKAQRRKK